MELVTTTIELSKELVLEDSVRPPQLRRRHVRQRLPGQPRIWLDRAHFVPYLRKAHLTEQLDKIVPYVKALGLATPTSTHVSPLHHQAARQRRVIVAESPHLHLVWYHDHIYVKPIPEYMLSSAFWKFLENTDLELWRACAGFMRSYYYLIQYQIDFRQAVSSELGLIPATVGGRSVDFEDFTEFIEPFASLSDDNVNPRFTFGELRLTRLNILTRLILWKATYHHEHAQWSAFLGRHIAPFVAGFGILSIVLNAMQVGLATDSVSDWHVFSRVSWWFAVVVIVLVMVVVVFYVLLMTFLLASDFAFAKRMEYMKKRSGFQEQISEAKSGVV